MSEPTSYLLGGILLATLIAHQIAMTVLLYRTYVEEGEPWRKSKKTTESLRTKKSEKTRKSKKTTTSKSKKKNKGTERK